jgi:hypothetical protein
MGTMTDNLTVDGATLANVSTGFAAQGYAMPLQTTVSVGNCGSGAVRAAANGFSMWASVTEMVASHTITNAAADLHSVAVTFGDWDDQAAQSAHPGMF